MRRGSVGKKCEFEVLTVFNAVFGLAHIFCILSTVCQQNCSVFIILLNYRFTSFILKLV